MPRSRYGSGTEKYAVRTPRHYTSRQGTSRQGNLSAEVVISPTALLAREAAE